MDALGMMWQRVMLQATDLGLTTLVVLLRNKLLLESGDGLLLEDGTSFLLLE